MIKGQNFMKLTTNISDHNMDLKMSFCHNGFNNAEVIAVLFAVNFTN